MDLSFKLLEFELNLYGNMGIALSFSFCIMAFMEPLGRPEKVYACMVDPVPKF